MPGRGHILQMLRDGVLVRAAPAVEPAAGFQLDDIRAQHGEQFCGIGACPGLSQYQATKPFQGPGAMATSANGFDPNAIPQGAGAGKSVCR